MLLPEEGALSISSGRRPARERHSFESRSDRRRGYPRLRAMVGIRKEIRTPLLSLLEFTGDIQPTRNYCTVILKK